MTAQQLELAQAVSSRTMVLRRAWAAAHVAMDVADAGTDRAMQEFAYRQCMYTWQDWNQHRDTLTTEQLDAVAVWWRQARRDP